MTKFYQFIFLIFSETGSFTKRVKFCYVSGRDFIRNDCPSNKHTWKFNFDLYGGTSSSNQTITLYSRFNSNPHSTNLFLNNSVDITNFIEPDQRYAPREIFIPGKTELNEIITAFWSSRFFVKLFKYKPIKFVLCFKFRDWEKNGKIFKANNILTTAVLRKGH